MLIGDREERLPRRKFKERHRYRVKERETDRGERREERRGGVSKTEQERHLSRFQRYLCPQYDAKTAENQRNPFIFSK